MSDTHMNKFGQITVVEHKDLIDKRSLTRNGELQYRMLPIHAMAFDAVMRLMPYFDGNATCQGQPVTKSAIQQSVQNIVSHLARAGWQPGKAEDAANDQTTSYHQRSHRCWQASVSLQM